MTKNWNEAISDQKTLLQAWHRVKSSGGGPGVDGISIELFQNDCDQLLHRLRQQLVSSSFKFSRLRPAIIPKDDGGQRKLLIPTVEDRVVLQSLRLAIEPFFEPRFLDCSHAYRPERGAFTAMMQISDALQQGFRYIVESDIRAFYDSIRHADLLKSVSSIEPALAQYRLLIASLKLSAGWWPAKKGLAQGSPLSPLLANVSLMDFDQRMMKSKMQFVRYADDFIVLCKNDAACQAALQLARSSLGRIGLELHPDKTGCVDSRCTAFHFLGFEIHPDRIIPSQENLAELRSGLLAWCNPNLQLTWSERIERINGLLRSFAWYYHQTDSRRLFWSLDQYVIEQLELLENLIGKPDNGWRGQLIRMSDLREVSWKGKHRSRSWNGYGG